MANERTFLTYLRTSPALMGFGLALIQSHPLRGAALGYGALVVAGVALLVGCLRFRMRWREIEGCRLPASVTPWAAGADSRVNEQSGEMGS